VVSGELAACGGLRFGTALAVLPCFTSLAPESSQDQRGAGEGSGDACAGALLCSYKSTNTDALLVQKYKY
jgi:hypothetical protein